MLRKKPQCVDFSSLYLGSILQTGNELKYSYVLCYQSTSQMENLHLFFNFLLIYLRHKQLPSLLVHSAKQHTARVGLG